MEKIIVNLPKPEIVKTKYAGYTIGILPIIDSATKVVLINNYVQTLVTDNANEDFASLKKLDYLEAEMNLKFQLLQTNTNIDVVQSSLLDIYADDSLWAIIQEHITNWYSFRYELDSVVELAIKQLEIHYSFGRVVEEISGKIISFLENLTDLNPEALKEIQAESLKMLQELQKSPLLFDGVKESE